MVRKPTKQPKSTASVEKSTKATTTGDTTAPDGAAPKVMAPPKDEKTLGKRELIDRVVIASGIKKKAAKPVIEAMLRELGDALSRGETLNLQPLGKGIVKSRKDLENAEVVELRLRRSKLAMAANPAPTPDTEAKEEDGATPSSDPVPHAAE